MLYTTISIIAGYIMDLLFGDPYFIPHPVVAAGRFITFCTDRLLNENDTPARKRRNGFIMVIAVLFLSAFIPYCILYIAYSLSIFAGIFIESIMCWQILAAKSLRTESTKSRLHLKTMI